MSEQRPPTIDPVAAARWHAMVSDESPWLHEEVARRMQDRLQWMVNAPTAWCDWDPLRGGMQGHALVSERFAQAACQIHETSSPQGEALARERLARRWWSPARWIANAPRFGQPEAASVQMLWSNMALHMAADPQALVTQWHRALAVDGYLMVSCLGPDTARELRALYAEQGWPPAGHAFTDMHDWGDMLVHSGFAEPVMDMERITLTFESPARLLQELRELGCNLHPARVGGLRGRQWRKQLVALLARGAESGRLPLTFEVIYGHALKPQPRVRLDAHSAVSLQDMRAMLQSGKP